MEHKWTRKLTVIAGESRPGDWTVICDGHEVGRIMFSDQVPLGPRWDWGTWTYPSRRGRCPTLEEALEETRKAVLASTGQLAPSPPDYKARWVFGP